MPRVSRSPHRDRREGGHSSDSVDQSSQATHDESCCRQGRRCRRLMEEPSPSRHQESRNDGRCNVRRQRERRDDLRDRARREALLEVAERNDKPSTRSRVCRWANIAMGVVIALGLVFVFYVITTIIIDGSSPLDSLFGHKGTVDPNLNNFNSSYNISSGVKNEVQIKSTVETKEVTTFSTTIFISTITSTTAEAESKSKNEKNTKKNNTTEFSNIANGSSGDGHSYSNVLDTLEAGETDDYYYDDNEEDMETRDNIKEQNNKEDNEWGESILDPLVNHDNHRIPDRKKSLSAQIIVNRKGLPTHSLSDSPHSISNMNLERSFVDLKFDPLTTYPRTGQYRPLKNEASRRNVFLSESVDGVEDDTSYSNVHKRRNGNLPYYLSTRNIYSDSERYRLPSTRGMEDNTRPSNLDYRVRYRDREYHARPRDSSRNRGHVAFSYNKPTFHSLEDLNPSISQRYRFKNSRDPYYSGSSKSYYTRDSDPYSYGRSLSSTPSSSSNLKFRKLSEFEKSQILELARLKRHRHLSSLNSDNPSKVIHSTHREYKYPPSATSIQDVIDYMNYEDRHDTKSREISNSEEIFQNVRISPGYVIGDQDHVIGNNVFKQYNEFAIDYQNPNPINDNLPVILHKNKNHFNKNLYNVDDSLVSNNHENQFNNYKYNNANVRPHTIDPRLPLEDAYPSRPRPEQDDPLYPASTNFPYFNKMYPTLRGPYVGTSSSRSNVNPFTLNLDIYPSEDISDPSGELRTHLSLSDEFQNEYEHMRSADESKLRSSENNQDKREIILHLNLYSKPIPSTHSYTSSNKQEDVSLEFPLTGRLSPLDIYRAVVRQKRLSPIASAQTGNYSESTTEQLSVDPSLDLIDAHSNSKLYAAIVEGLKGLDPYLPESRKISFIDSYTPSEGNKSYSSLHQ